MVQPPSPEHDSVRSAPGQRPVTVASGTAPQPEPPRSLRLAVRLMRVEAGVALLPVPGAWLLRDDLDSGLRSSFAAAGATVSDGFMSFLFVIVAGIVAVPALCVAGLWAWMAVMNERGRRWARVVATVLLLLSVPPTLFTLVAKDMDSGWVDPYVLLCLLGGVIATVLLYLPDARAYSRASDVARRRC